MKMKKIFIILVLLLALGYCTSPNLVDNPIPFLEFTKAPAEGDTLDVDYTAFKWKGGNTDYQFKYSLYYFDKLNFPTLYSGTGDWSSIQEINFSNLDEGNYTMKVLGKSYDIVDSIQLSFIVDAIKGAAVLFYKNETTVRKGDTTLVRMWVENADSLVAFHAAVYFNKEIVNLVKVENGSLARLKNFNQVILPPQLVDTSFTAFDDSAHISLINSLGRFEITSGFFPNNTFNAEKSISGSGSLLNMYFTGKSEGDSQLGFSIVELFDENHSTEPKPAVKTGKIIVLP